MGSDSLRLVAESYQLSPSSEPPRLENVTISRPRDIPPSRWGPSGSRNISITASICLDFAMPGIFNHFNSRPGLILAPARTWETSVGISMWLQARQRAIELDSTVLWCDGGKGGVSGVAGGGYDTFQQVGPGSWVKNIALGYPFNHSRTLFARWGDMTILIYWIGVLSPAAIQFLMTKGVADGVRLIRSSRNNGQGERRPLLENTAPLIDYS